jgi:hypothetical protein
MHMAILSCKARWFGGKGVNLLGVQGPILTNDMGCGQRW